MEAVFTVVGNNNNCNLLALGYRRQVLRVRTYRAYIHSMGSPGSLKRKAFILNIPKSTIYSALWGPCMWEATAFADSSRTFRSYVKCKDGTMLWGRIGKMALVGGSIIIRLR